MRLFGGGVVQKIANYRRAIWLVREGPLLEQLLRTHLGACPDVLSTKFEYKAGVAVQISDRSIGTGIAGLGCYLTMFAEGSPAATVENGGPHVRRRRPPRGEEFIKTGIYFVVEGNHLGYVANGFTNDGQITTLLQRFLQTHGLRSQDTQFALMPRADRREIERLLRTGVKSIDLGVSAFLATADDIGATVARQQAGGLENFRAGTAEMARGLWRVLSSGRTQQEIEAAADIQARIHLGYDGRTASALLPVLLSQIGTNVADSEDEFKIITTDDVVITRDKLVIKREIDIEGDDIALEPTSAFAELRVAMRGWRNAGLFEQ